MTSPLRMADKFMDVPVAEMNPATLVIELAAGHVNMMLNRAPLSPATTEKYLRQLAEILASHRPELDVRRATYTLERSEDPSESTVARFLAAQASKAKKDGTTPVLAVAKRETPPPLRFSGPINQGEAEVVYRIAAGMTRDEVAKDIYLSVDAVKSRLLSITKKLGLPRGIQAHVVAECLRNGYIDVPKTIHLYGAHCPMSNEQVQTVRYIAFGLQAKEIGVEMGVSEGTVKSRIEWAAKNLHITCNQPLLVATAFANGWID